MKTSVVENKLKVTGEETFLNQDESSTSLDVYLNNENKINSFFWRRVFDITFSILAIIIFSPLMFIIYLLIKFQEGGKVIYKQERLGLNGKKFIVYKFRTMYENNEDILKEYLEKNPTAKKEWDTFRKLKGYDPRVTKVGRFLRRTSLDELPQFFNVLKGDMSVVGPRPYIDSEFDEFAIPTYVRKTLLSVKPGITGLWQVTKRSDSPFLERVEIDLQYIKNRSFWLDLKIILKTIWVMLHGRGAY